MYSKWENNQKEETEKNIFSVTALNRQIKNLLENNFNKVVVKGEISGCKPAASGHYYFSLKDEKALVDAVMWKGSAAKLKEIPKDGEMVIAKGEITVYEPKGKYQLVVQSLMKDGYGELQKKFEQLKEKLEIEGLLDFEKKKPLPEYPRVVGIVTSKTGAALRDIIKIFKRRAPGIKLIVSPSLVQGEKAAEDIVRAFTLLEKSQMPEVIIVARGGGSVEDLWAFNEEIVARKIAQAKIPVVSAIGHEVDVTIADLVADRRAATPSEAAEVVAPDVSNLKIIIEKCKEQLNRALQYNINRARRKMEKLAEEKVFTQPMRIIENNWQKVDILAHSLKEKIDKKVEKKQHEYELLNNKIQALSPLAVLARGYAVVVDKNNKVVKNYENVKIGEDINIHLQIGKISAKVENKTPEK